MRIPDSATVTDRARTIGANIRTLAQMRGMSLAKLGVLVGLERQAIWKVANGAPRTPFAQYEAIAAALGVTVGELAGPREAPRRRRRSA